MAAARGQDVQADSAGTSDWHIGAPPHAPAITAAHQRGIDLSDLRARQFTAADFTAFDLIIPMDHANQSRVEALRPPGNTVPVRLMLDFAPDVDQAEVPDPYYTGDYTAALDLIEHAATGLLDQLLQNASASALKSL